MAQIPKAGIAGMIGSSVGEAAAFAAGLAIAPLLEPVVQELRNTTWPQYPDKPLDPETVAEVVAEGFLSEGAGAGEAVLSGVSGTRFGHVVETARAGPAISEARELVRRGKLTTDQLHLAYRKAKIDPQWFGPLDILINQPLPPAVAALAAVRGLIDDEGTLPVGPPAEQGVIPKFPVYPISGKEAAAAVGLSDDAYAVMVGINGRPMSLHEAASAYFRGIIEQADYYRAVAEGDTRNEWRDAILEQARQIVSAHDAVENAIRGYSSQETMRERTARHGMSPDDTEILFQNAGRPLVVHQITTALARGATFHPEPGELTDPYEASVHESNIKPSYYEMAIANKYSYPPLFQINQLVKSNAITADTARDWATKNGLAPEVVDALFTFWQKEQGTSGTGAGAGAKGYTYSQIHQAWRHAVFTDAQAVAELEAIGYTAAKAETLLSTWKASSAAG